MASQEDRLAALSGGLHFKQGKAWVCLDGHWIRWPTFDRA
jgi:hypothetical protein